MADKYVNSVDLSYFWGRIKNIFATKTEVETLSNEIDEIVAEGGEPNVITAVKVNGSELTITDKAVDVTVPTTVAELTDASDYATTNYVDENGGKIDSIKVNGTEQTITSKSVDITVPTVISELTNDSGFQTASDVNSAISSAVTSVYRYKGSVATYSDLPSEATEGDVYDVQSSGMNYAWNGSRWDELGSEFDGSTLWAKDELVAMTTAEIDEVLNG